MIRIMIADDHAMIRQGLRRVLEAEGDMKVVGEAENGQEALIQGKKTSPDLILLDIIMPGRDSLEIVEELKRCKPELRILMLTSHAEDQYALRCLRAGADGYLRKTGASEDLVAAIRKIHGGGKYISDKLAELLALSLTKDSTQAPHELLSNREFQVLRMIGGGQTVSEISDELNLSVKTISTYRARILEKTQMKNNAEIMRYVLEHELGE